MYFQLTLEGLKCPKKVQFEHKIYSTMCGRNVQAIWDHKNSTRLAGGGQGKSKCAPEMALIWLRSSLEASKLFDYYDYY